MLAHSIRRRRKGKLGLAGTANPRGGRGAEQGGDLVRSGRIRPRLRPETPQCLQPLGPLVSSRAEQSVPTSGRVDSTSA